MPPGSSRASGTLRFLLDENLPYALALKLADQGHDVLDIAASVHRGKTDTELWDIAIAERRVVVTRDLDFPLQNMKSYPPGLIIIRPMQAARASEITGLFDSAFALLDEEAILGKITVIQPGRIRQRDIAKTSR